MVRLPRPLDAVLIVRKTDAVAALQCAGIACSHTIGRLLKKEASPTPNVFAVELNSV